MEHVQLELAAGLPVFLHERSQYGFGNRKGSSELHRMHVMQDRAARAAVQLPYVHQGARKSHKVADFRQHLPPAAGGYGPGVEDAAGSGKLGHILYVRDSEEEHDGDEDPDDDLDI